MHRHHAHAFQAQMWKCVLFRLKMGSSTGCVCVCVCVCVELNTQIDEWLRAVWSMGEEHEKKNDSSEGRSNIGTSIGQNSASCARRDDNVSQ